MNEQQRLQELEDYQILDTLPEKEFDDIVELASAICNTPISLLSLVDSERQWFKAKVGLEVEQTPREHAFCQHALSLPNDVLVVENPQEDPRFKNNPLVTSDPHIRFYAGASLTTEKGNVLGTLCVIDKEGKKLNPEQRRALEILSKQVMEKLEQRKKEIKSKQLQKDQEEKLRKLAEQAPGAIYQFEITPDGKMSFPFVSRGITAIHPQLTPELLEKDAKGGFELIHPDDLPIVMNSIKVSMEKLTNWNVEYRVLGDDGLTRWHWAYSSPEKKADGTVVWYGFIQDITQKKNDEVRLKKYVEKLESIHYARKIQNSLLQSEGAFKETVPNSFVLDIPKEIISGDFFYSMKMDNLLYITAADSTGHGVPGAMMSITCCQSLKEAILMLQTTDVGRVLNKTNQILNRRINSEGHKLRDGMDLALVCIDTSSRNNKLYYAGAYNPAYLANGNTGELNVLKADRQPIGKYSLDAEFGTQEVTVKPGDSLFMVSDGIQDQFGGPQNKKFGRGKLREFFQEHYKKGPAEVKNELEQQFLQWKNGEEQTDDVLAVGIKF